jgi:hypothetical protein
VNERDYPARQSAWTMTAPDGRYWVGMTALAAYRAAQAESLPYSVTRAMVMAAAPEIAALQARCAALEAALRNAAGSIHGALDDWRKTREICLSDLEQALYDARGAIRAASDAPAEGAKE